MATRLELCTSASSASGATADEAAAEGDRAAERGGARRVDTRLELCTRGSSTIPSCAPASARTTGTARRAREGRLFADREGTGGVARVRRCRRPPRVEQKNHHHLRVDGDRKGRRAAGRTCGAGLGRGRAWREARARTRGSSRACSFAASARRGVTPLAAADPTVIAGQQPVSRSRHPPPRRRNRRRDPEPRISRPFADSLERAREPAEARNPFKFDRHYR